MQPNTPDYKKTAFLITVLLILTALGCLIWILCKGHPSDESSSLIAGSDPNSSRELIADIYQDGTLLQSIPLNTVEESYSFTITGENGCRNEVEVRPGSIGIISADCPDKLCVHQGFISTSLLPLTCLPNHLVIQIRSEDTSLDIVTY